LEGVVVDGLDLVGQGIGLGDADGQLGVELVGEADAVGLDEEREVPGVDAAAQLGRGAVEDLNLRQLIVGDAQRPEGVVIVVEHDLQQVVPRPRLEGLDLGRGREERRGDTSADLQIHRSLTTGTPVLAQSTRLLSSVRSSTMILWRDGKPIALAIPPP
jgi:hypothetical protein